MTDRPTTTSLHTKPIGVSGLTHYADGRIYEEYLRELQGDKWRRAIREMTEGDAVIGAIRFMLQMLVRQVKWTVTPAGEEPEAQDAATFVDDCLHDMRETWQLTLAEALSFLDWGWSAMEKVYKVRRGVVKTGGEVDKLRSSKYADGRIGWASWSIRGQDTLDRWEFREGEPAGFWQLSAPDFDWHYVPLGKCLHFRATSRKGNPEGVSIYRNAYESWYYKKNIRRIEAIGIERDLAGYPVGRIPGEILNAAELGDATSAAIVTAWKKIVTNVRRDEQEGLLIPSDRDDKGHPLYDLTLLSTGGTRSFDTDAVIQRYNAEIAESVLAGIVLIGHEKVGSFSLASSKTELLATALGAFLDSIAEEVQASAIAELCDLNGIGEDLTPTLAHDDIEHVDLEALASYVDALAKAGFPVASGAGADQRFIYLLTQAGIPAPSAEDLEGEQKEREEQEKEKERERLEQQQQVPPAPPNTNGHTPAPLPPARAAETDALDALLDETERDALTWARQVANA